MWRKTTVRSCFCNAAEPAISKYAELLCKLDFGKLASVMSTNKAYKVPPVVERDYIQPGDLALLDAKDIKQLRLEAMKAKNKRSQLWWASTFHFGRDWWDWCLLNPRKLWNATRIMSQQSSLRIQMTFGKSLWIPILPIVWNGMMMTDLKNGVVQYPVTLNLGTSSPGQRH